MIHQRGFTLAELLIALAILGVIATFTIPKVLQSQGDQKYNAAAKEAIAALSEAYQKLQLEGRASSSTSPADLTPLLNYVRLDTTSAFDDIQTSAANMNCNGAVNCLRMHNGAMIIYYPYSFGGTAATNTLEFFFDPDGKVTSGTPTTNGPGKGLRIFLMYNGRITTFASVPNGANNSNGFAWSPCAACDPPWFSW